MGTGRAAIIPVKSRSIPDAMPADLDPLCCPATASERRYFARFLDFVSSRIGVPMKPNFLRI